MKFAQDAHTRAEQQVYEYLWENAQPHDEVSRTITIGFGAMARVVRLSESNTRINLRNLTAKLAVEELASYNCERSVGRTYRIFNYSEILRRRRQAGLLWYMRRTLAVVFVHPTTGQPLDLGLKNHHKLPKTNSIPGLTLVGAPGLNIEVEPGPNLDTKPGPNLLPLNREEKREETASITSSSTASLLYQALSHYGTADDDVITRLRQAVRRTCPDATDEEIIHFIHAKGELVKRRDSTISSPIGFLLTSVPKCFVGDSFQHYRAAERERCERENAEHRRQIAEMEEWRREQQAILDDPKTSEEEKRWARKWLYPEEGG